MTQLAFNLDTGQGIDGNESKRRSRIKKLKKIIHRAEQRPNEGVSIYEVTCPTCAAQGHNVRQDHLHQERCRPPTGGYLPPHYFHLSRRKRSEQLMQEIQDAATAARKELEELCPKTYTRMVT